MNAERSNSAEWEAGTPGIIAVAIEAWYSTPNPRRMSAVFVVHPDDVPKGVRTLLGVPIQKSVEADRGAPRVRVLERIDWRAWRYEPARVFDRGAVEA